jgi:hypothetical protein
MRVLGFGRHHNHETPWDSAPPWALEIGLMASLIIQNLEIIMTVSAEVQTALDAVRQTKSLVQSVDAGIKVNNTLITDLQAQIAALQAGQVLSADDKAALAETASTLADVNTQLASDIPAGVTQP